MRYRARSLRHFQELVSQALEGLPSELSDRMSNVEIIVEDRPGPETGDLEPNGPNGNEDLLGLYLGVPLTERGEGYFGVLPDRIILYRRNIEAEATSRSDLTEIVRRTVIHEIAHHFGIDDERLEELGWD